MTFNGGETRDSVLKGFTVTNGNGTVTADGNCGGGIYCSKASPTITDNIIEKNNISSVGHPAGGGIYLRESGTALVSQNLIRSNDGACDGGGILSAPDVVPEVTDNVISENKATTGGGIKTRLGKFTYNLIIGNFAGENGGGVCSTGKNTTDTFFYNCTFSQNVCGKYGGGLFVYYDHTSTVKDCIFWDNYATYGKEISINQYDTVQNPPSYLYISYSDVDGGQSSVYVEKDGSQLYWGSGMIASDPEFTTGPGVNYLYYPNYYLAQDPCQPGMKSPCVDTGDGAVIDGTTRTDHVQDQNTVDMGFHYYPFDPPPPPPLPLALFVYPRPLVAGRDVLFTATKCDKYAYAYLVASFKGKGSTFIPWLNVTLDLHNPILADDIKLADKAGIVSWRKRVPAGMGGKIWFQTFQAVEDGKVSNVVATAIQ